MRVVRFAGPSVHWPSVRRIAGWGPLVGGAPYAWTLVAIPFAYAIGLAPAIVAGLVYGLWRGAAHGRPPTARWRFAVGAASGAFAAGWAGLVLGLLTSDADAWQAAAVVAIHGMPAAAVLAILEPRARRAPCANSVPTIAQLPK